MYVNRHLYLLLQCHLNVSYLVESVNSISNVSINVYYMSNSKLCVSIDVHFLFDASFGMSNVRNLQKLYQKYTCFIVDRGEYPSRVGLILHLKSDIMKLLSYTTSLLVHPVYRCNLHYKIIEIRLEGFLFAVSYLGV